MPTRLKVFLARAILIAFVECIFVGIGCAFGTPVLTVLVFNAVVAAWAALGWALEVIRDS